MATDIDPSTNPATTEPADDVDEKAAAQRAADQRLVELINSAVSTHTRRLEKKFSERLEKLAPAAHAPAEAAEVDEPERKPGAKPAAGAAHEPAKPDPAVATMQKELERLKSQVAQAERDKIKAEAKAARKDARMQLRGALESAGVRPDMLDIAVVHLAKATKALRMTEDGAPVLRVTRARVKNAAPERLEFADLHEGARDWAKSVEAKVFLPAPQAKKSDAATPGGFYRGTTGEPYADPVTKTLAQLGAAGIDPTALFGDE